MFYIEYKTNRKLLINSNNNQALITFAELLCRGNEFSFLRSHQSEQPAQVSSDRRTSRRSPAADELLGKRSATRWGFPNSSFAKDHQGDR